MFSFTIILFVIGSDWAIISPIQGSSPLYNKYFCQLFLSKQFKKKILEKIELICQGLNMKVHSAGGLSRWDKWV